MNKNKADKERVKTINIIEENLDIAKAIYWGLHVYSADVMKYLAFSLY